MDAADYPRLSGLDSDAGDALPYTGNIVMGNLLPTTNLAVAAAVRVVVSIAIPLGWALLVEAIMRLARTREAGQ